MDSDSFRRHGHELVDWIADYMKEIRSYPVRSQVKPREIYNQLPDQPNDQSESFNEIFKDFIDVIIPGITHWQHPNFHAYFQANSSPPSILAEMLIATLNPIGFSWITSPAATELEQKVMEWLRDMLGLDPNFKGVIQDTASSSSLVALLTAREKHSNYSINQNGFNDGNYRIYASTQAHSSIEKGVKIAGFGKSALQLIPVDENYAIIPEELEKSIISDKKAGYIPLLVVGVTGTTGSTALDPLDKLADICQRHNLWFHVDAALAGSALILPEMRWIAKGVEKADSFVFNPHKWLFTNFDCSAYFVKDHEALVKNICLKPRIFENRRR
jgi:aromatic-L-amino-acid decarboxylase